MSAPTQQSKLSLAISQSMEIIYSFLLDIFPKLDVDICPQTGFPTLDRANYQMEQRALQRHRETLTLAGMRGENEDFTKELAGYFNTLSRVSIFEKIGETSRLVHEATQELARAAQRHQEILQIRAKTMEVFVMEGGEVALQIGSQWSLFRTAARRDFGELEEAYRTCVEKVDVLNARLALLHEEMFERIREMKD